jgi:hypothetical protein
MVSDQKIWLGMGVALCLAGMDCACVFCGIAWHISHWFTSWQTHWLIFYIGSSPDSRFDYYLLHKRRETTLALGKGLDFAYGFAA